MSAFPQSIVPEVCNPETVAKGHQSMRQQLKTAALRATYYSGAHRLISRRYSGVGTIFVIHKVVTEKTDSLATWLTITVDFLDRVLALLKPRADFVRLDDVRERLTREEPAKAGRPFIALTFDDGFRDNLTLALPILRRHTVPATVYVPSGAPDRSLDPWPWRLEKAIRGLSELSLDLPELPRQLSLRTFDEKQAAFSLITEHVHSNIPANRHLPELLLSKARVSDESLIAEQFASWDELRELASDRLVTIGGHTVTHPSLHDLEEDQAMAEIGNGRRRLEAQLDVAVAHFAYPYGARSNCGIREFALAERAGFVTGVTARDGNIFHQHRDHLMCLPRRGLCRSKEEISSPVLDLSGVPAALSSRWRNPLVTM
jgi:peptidoglycan/xylan/chitin deacetylase (PgdA/CDA1 family)